MKKTYETRTESVKEVLYITSLFATYKEFIIDHAIVYLDGVYDIDVTVDISQTPEGREAWSIIHEALALVEDYVAD